MWEDDFSLLDVSSPRRRRMSRSVSIRLIVWCLGWGALLAVVMPASAAHADRGKPSEKQALESAKAHLLKGDAAFREERYADAMIEFEAGYAAVPRPGFLFNMGHVQRKMGNLERAREYYRAYLTLEPTSKRRAEIEAILTEIDLTLSSSTNRPADSLAPPPASQPPEAGLRLDARGGDREVPAALKVSAREFNEERSGSPFYKKPWIWAAAGGALVGAALVVFFASRGSDYTEKGSWGALGQ